LSLFAFASIQLVILVLWSVRNLIHSSFSVPAAALSLSAAVLMLPIFHFEHIKSVRPSSLLNAYLPLSSLLEAAQVRTLWLIADDRLIAILSTISLGLRITSAILESCGKETSLGVHPLLIHDRI
jgi:ATP-binding cassette subfamily C (CFTR/MRP) protein 1